MTPGIYTPEQIQGWKKSLKLSISKGEKSLFSFGMWGVAAMPISPARNLWHHRRLAFQIRCLARWLKAASVWWQHNNQKR